MTIEIVPYQPSLQGVWDTFVDRSRNGHFMMRRGYLDYHADRFVDRSLLFFRAGEPIALLPAHNVGGELISHGGLPFGGLVASPVTLHADAKGIVESLLAWLPENGFHRLVYTPAPTRYHAAPFEDDLYLLQEAGARCHSMRLSNGFAGPVPALIGKATKRNLRKAERRFPGSFFETNDITLFWSHLERCLREQKGARPLHSAAEMRLLRDRFPEHIRLFLAEMEGEIVAGEVIYLTAAVLRFQYSFRHRSDSSSVSRRLYLWLAAHPEFTRAWIDLGTSIDPVTGVIDTGLLTSKEQSGARGTVVQTWVWDAPGSDANPPKALPIR